MKGVWQKIENQFRFTHCESPVLRPGFYNAQRNYDEVFLEQASMHLDEAHNIEDPTTKHLIDTTKEFFKAKDRYAKLGALHKRGILLYGPPGVGKSTVLNMLSQVIIDNNGVVLIVKQNDIGCVETLMHQIRDSAPEQMIGVILEDIETYISRDEPLKMLLGLLSGQAQVNGVLFMATTNVELSEIPNSLRARPSRFDVLQYIGFPNAAIKLQFLKKFCKKEVSNKVLEEIANSTEGLSIAHLKEIIIDTYCLDSDLQSSISRVSKMSMDVIPQIYEENT